MAARQRQGVPLPAGTPQTLPSTTIVWPSHTMDNASFAQLSTLLPANVPLQFSSVSSGSNNYWVGGEATVQNSGIQTTIQVASQQVTGCLSYWIADDSAVGIWGQVGYYICNGSSPIAFYQIWNLSTNSILVTGTTSVSTGYHQFSMYWKSGTTWAFALDGKVFGSYGMGASLSSSSYPVEVFSEEGYVSGAWNPSAVEFSTAIQVLQSGTWSTVQSAVSYGTAWGLAGNHETSSLPDDAIVFGGSTATQAGGTMLWNGGTTTTSTSTTASTSVSSSLTSTSSTSATSRTSTISTSTSSSSSSQSSSGLKASLSISPASTTRKSTVYSTVQVTDQNGNPVGRASVPLTVTTPVGKVSTVSGTTDNSGRVYFQYKVSAAAPMGTYRVSAVATDSGYTSGTASGTFSVS